MNKETIKVLKDLRMGKDFPLYKPLDETEKETFKTLSKLKNLGVLKLESKTRYKTYLVNDIKLLSKFIELQDFEKLSKYIENRYELNNGNVTHNYHNVSQVNQSSGNIDLKSPIEQKINNHNPNTPSKISTLQKLYWLIGILVALTILYEFVIKKFMPE